MIPALSIKHIEEKLDEKCKGEHRIVGIMLARYDIALVKDVIAECYSYWNENAGRGFDLFWPGYGYSYVDDGNTSRTLLRLTNNPNRLFFDSKIFVECKNALNNYIKHPYRDKFELLLVNYNVDHIEFDKNIRIDLEQNCDQYFGNIREIMEYVIGQCKSESDVVSLHRKILAKELFTKIKGISVSDAVIKIIGIAT